MTRALLDVNVLLALLDADHVDHGRALAWFDREAATGWASCAITENGFVRILSQPRYPSPVPADQAAGLLRRARREGDHRFWPCDISLLDQAVVRTSRVHGPRQVTDVYLLALAVANHGRLATFDRAVPLSAVNGATNAHLAML